MTWGRPYPVTIRGVTYPSIRAAAVALGVHYNAVQSARKRGTLDRVGIGVSGPIPYPVTVRGVTYASAKEAAQCLGVDRETIYSALESATIDRVGLNGRQGRRTGERVAA